MNKKFQILTMTACVSIAGLYFVNKATTADSDSSEAKQLSDLGHRETPRLSATERLELISRLRSEMEEQQDALQSGQLSASDYQDWLYDGAKRIKTISLSLKRPR